jgi:hypothetical protein
VPPDDNPTFQAVAKRLGYKSKDSLVNAEIREVVKRWGTQYLNHPDRWYNK